MQSVPRFLAASPYVTVEYRNQENTHQHLTACGVPVSNLRALRVIGKRGGRQNLFNRFERAKQWQRGGPSYERLD